LELQDDSGLETGNKTATFYKQQLVHTVTANTAKLITSGYATYGSRPGVQSASLYDNFCKTRNYVIYDVIIWVQDGNCKKMAPGILVLCVLQYNQK